MEKGGHPFLVNIGKIPEYAFQDQLPYSLNHKNRNCPSWKENGQIRRGQNRYVSASLSCGTRTVLCEAQTGESDTSSRPDYSFGHIIIQITAEYPFSARISHKCHMTSVTTRGGIPACITHAQRGEALGGSRSLPRSEPSPFWLRLLWTSAPSEVQPGQYALQSFQNIPHPWPSGKWQETEQ